MKKTLILVAMLSALAGCATVGNQSLTGESSATVARNVTEGVTTTQEIRSLYGEPADVVFTDSGLMQWKYELVHAENDAKNFIPFYGMFKSKVHVRKQQLIVLFDDNGVVKKFNMSTSLSEQRVGLFK